MPRPPKTLGQCRRGGPSIKPTFIFVMKKKFLETQNNQIPGCFFGSIEILLDDGVLFFLGENGISYRERAWKHKLINVLCPVSLEPAIVQQARDVDPMLGRRRRRWPNLKTIFAQRHVHHVRDVH